MCFSSLYITYVIYESRTKSIIDDSHMFLKVSYVLFIVE